MDYGAWEIGEYFAGPPDVYHLQLPGKLRMKGLVRRAVRGLRRTDVVRFEELLRRPLNEEACFLPIKQAFPQDYEHVQKALEGYFGRKGFVVKELRLVFHKHEQSSFPYDPYDLVKAHFTVQKART